MGLKGFIIRRSIEVVIIFFLMITFDFFLFRIMPGDPTAILVGNPHITEEARRRIIHQFGLDQPLWLQYLLFFKSLLRGDFGESFYFTGYPVSEIIFGNKMINTLALMTSSVALAILIGIIFGIVSAWRRESKLDVISLITSMTLLSSPSFFIGMILLLVFGYYIRIIPIGGTITSGLKHATTIGYILDYLHHMAAPMITLTLIFWGQYYLFMRNSMLDVLTQDYIVMAKARGVPKRKIMFKHAAKNAILPLISVVAINAASIVGGAILTETVFSWNGIGRLMYIAVISNDYPVLQGLFIILSIAVLISNFIADILYGYLDPRIKY